MGGPYGSPYVPLHSSFYFDKIYSMHAIQPTRQENYNEWYQQVIREADLAETSPVRGCMIVKPTGYALWEQMQHTLDAKFKETGHQNVYFPLFIPLSFFEKEAEHVDGFAKECAVVTHRRLEAAPGGGLQPAGPLEEPLIVRPTSETVIGAAFAKWIQSYRDLPLLVNQWCNVVRWEMRTRLFLRTTEFLWQEGHTAHATSQQAQQETRQMLDVYADFARQYMALPVICGKKCSWERFPGAVDTYCIEAMMQDGKALQAGTSHFLGQNFSRASDIRFQNEQGQEEFAWTTSWGVSTRLLGALIMAHSDDDGLVIPPRLAPWHVVILPIFRNDVDQQRVMQFCTEFADKIRAQQYANAPVRVQIDNRPLRGGDKLWSHVKRGTPLRIEIGPRDLDAGSVMLARRDHSPKQRQTFSCEAVITEIPHILNQIQDHLYQRALDFQTRHTCTITDRNAFEAWFARQEEGKHPGFALAPFIDDQRLVDALAPMQVTVRCIPFAQPSEQATCLFTGLATTQWAIYARAY